MRKQDAWNHTVIRNQELIKANQREMMSVLTAILKNTATPQVIVEDVSNEFNFPLGTLEQVVDCNKALEDKAKYAKMVSIEY